MFRLFAVLLPSASWGLANTIADPMPVITTGCTVRGLAVDCGSNFVGMNYDTQHVQAFNLCATNWPEYK